VWGASNGEQERMFAFGPADFIIHKMLETFERACAARSTKAPERALAALQNALEPFAMSRGRWRKKIIAIIDERSKPTV
jgi:hypothetical protein